MKLKDRPSTAQILWFRSAIDWWLAIILVALPITQIGTLTAALMSGESDAVVGALFGCAVVVVIYGLLLIPVRYGVTDDRLIIRFGVVRQRIALAEISEVYPSRNPLASPALSLDRLAIRTGEGMRGIRLVSPADRAEFLDVLASRAGLTAEGERLVRQQAGGGSV